MLLRAGARLPTFARHGLTWRDLAHSWYGRSYKHSKASEPRLALSYLRAFSATRKPLVLDGF